ncbi:DUF2637 domain-containing protein, partial [Streptomyces sp. NPDC002265]|uniref:DUF2637 domain-containing protein n=1 Tax=Streptomyces sp. NPDC002265 TaxID=3154415 RepID=UPI00331B079E
MTPAHRPPPHTPTAPAGHTAHAAAHPIRPDTPPRHSARRILAAVITAATLVVAGIGFAGSYAAVRELAIKKGFGNFSYVF